MGYIKTNEIERDKNSYEIAESYCDNQVLEESAYFDWENEFNF